MGNIYITGFMAAGKSSLGLILSEKLGWENVDLDNLIEKNSGLSIAEIFKEQGEEGFRKLECRALYRVASQHGLIVTTGGGTVLSSENRSLMKRTGIIIALGVSLKEAVKRANQDGGLDKRPILKRMETAYSFRQDLYREADFFIETDNKAPGTVAEEVTKYIKASFSFPLVRVTAGKEAYSVLIKPTSLGDLGESLFKLGARNSVVIFSDTNVWPLYQEPLKESLKSAGLSYLNWNVFPSEKNKSLNSARQAYDFLVEAGITRDTFAIAFGGGLVGDLGGFIAATYMRGIPFVQVPTSLLAQVDAGIGGKVAVNHPRGKNLIGTFYQPAGCLMDPLLLRSLPERKFKEGLAEVIKYALLTGGEMVQTLEKNKTEIFQKDPRVLSDVIHQCCKTKANYVMGDEKDFGIRRHLNLGHTLGHALETLTGYDFLYHGEAVSIGLVWAAFLSELLGVAEKGLTEYIKDLLSFYHLPTSLPRLVKGKISSREQLLNTMMLDKKADKASLNCILIAQPGKIMVQGNIPNAVLMEAFSVIGL